MAQRFVFRLEALLRVRATQEREAKRRLGAKQAELARLDELDRLAREEIAQRMAALAELAQSPLADVAEMTRRKAWIAFLRSESAERATARRSLTEELETLRAALLEARARTRVIEKLRERRWSEHVAAENRAEQSASDELARQLLVRREESLADEAFVA